MQGFHTPHPNGCRSRTRDLRAAGVEKVRKVYNVRFSRSVFDHRRSPRHHGRKHDVHGRADRAFVEVDRRPAQPVRRVSLHPIPAVNRCAERFKALDVQVKRTGAKVASAGERAVRTPESAQLRADQIGRPANAADERVGGRALRERGGVDANRGAIPIADGSAHLPQDVQRERNVADGRDVLQNADPAHQHRGKDDGERGILHAADRNFAHKGLSALDDEFVCHSKPFRRVSADSARCDDS